MDHSGRRALDEEEGHPASSPLVLKGHLEDTILHVSADGKVLEEISIIDAILKGGYQVDPPASGEADFETRDPTHLNNIELVTEELAERIPQVEAGDFLVSLRIPSALAVISRESGALVWSMVALTVPTPA